MYQRDEKNFDDICFTIFRCPFCENETMDLTLLPIVDKEQYADVDVQHTRELTLAKILDADFYFLHERKNCECTLKPILELIRVIYCFNHGALDFHNYIDYPFEKIKKIPINLNERSSVRSILFFDTETTGLPKNWKAPYKDLSNWPRLVQIAWIVADTKGNIIEEKDYLIKPDGFVISVDATNIHKISTIKALQNGHGLHYVLSQFNSCVKNVDFIVAHNMSFDINVVASEMYRSNIDSNIFEKNKICTMESTVNFCKLPGNYGYKFPKLCELYQKLFYTSIDEVHDAAVDIKTTVKCFFELIENETIRL